MWSVGVAHWAHAATHPAGKVRLLYCDGLVVGDRIMKLMVQSWIRDVTTYQNVFADQQIMHFYRSVEKHLLHVCCLY